MKCEQQICFIETLKSAFIVMKLIAACAGYQVHPDCLPLPLIVKFKTINYTHKKKKNYQSYEPMRPKHVASQIYMHHF